MNSGQYRAAWLGTVAWSIWMAAGCGTSIPPAPATPKPAAAAATAKPVAGQPQVQVALDATKAAAAKDTAAKTKSADKPADAATDAAVAESAAAAPPPPTFATERILLLLPRNPLIVEFQCSIDELPHTQALDRLVAEVLKAADTDGDGRPTWKEVTESKRFKYGQFGNVAITNENNYKQVIEMYDADRDAVVDASELPRFLTRNAGSARAFSVRGIADFRPSAGRDSPLWKLLDADDDGAISAEERAAAPGRLLSRDTDDDEILLPGDVNPRVPLDSGMMATRRRGRQTVVRLLGPHADWDSVKLSLERDYAGEAYVRADSFPLTPELFTQLDKNKDGKLAKAEYPALNEVPPHVVIAVNFGKASEPADEAPAEGSESSESTEDKNAAPKEPQPPPPPALRLVSIVPQLAEGPPAADSAAQQAGRITLRIGGTPLTFYLNDSVAGGNFEAQAKQALMGLDADKNGYLEEKELPENAAGQLGQFAAVDGDENGKVYLEEIISFLKQQQAGLRAQVHLMAAGRNDSLFSALDLNHDERLDAREIDAVPEQLALLDAGGDGGVTADEVPASLAVGLARGNLENLEGLFTPPPLIARAPAEGTPRWFTSMDGNGDGAISQREFLGPAEKFASLDASGDGLVDAAEAKAVAQPVAESESGD